jgi:hypothetical protein
MASGRSAAVQPVVDDLQRIFGDRLQAVVIYGWRPHGAVPSLVLVQSLTLEDLNACAERSDAWHRAGAATPLLLTRAEFARSLDAFPIEYGEIIEHHEVVLGTDPFDGLAIGRDDLRRACEVQVKSHLLHLREDYVEGAGRAGEIGSLVRESAPGFTALLRHLARLDGANAATPAQLVHYATDRIRLDAHVVGDLLELSDAEGLPTVDPVKLFPAYLAAMERTAEFVDQWRDTDGSRSWLGSDERLAARESGGGRGR